MRTLDQTTMSLVKSSETTNMRTQRSELLSSRVLALCFGTVVVLSLFSAVECHLFVGQAAPGIAFLPSLLYGCSVWLWWAPLTFAMVYGVERSHWFGKLAIRTLCVQILCALAAACLHLQLLVLCVHGLVARWPLLWDAGYNALPLWSFQRAVPEVLLYLLLWAAGSASRERRAARAVEREILTMRKSLAEAELLALQRQMQPHFLLNTLNSITGLLEAGEHCTALEIVGRLSTLLKRALQRDVPALVAVSDELETTEAYVAIEQTRFGERLQVELSVDPHVLGQRMPPFVLQPLVENAIKHSIHQDRSKCLVRIWLSCQDGRVTLRIADDGAGTGASKLTGSGVSLDNIHSRLQLLYPSDYRLDMQRAAQGGCEVNVSFPTGKPSA